VVVVPTSGYGESGIADGSRVLKMGLLELSSLSLENLSRLDDPVVTDILNDLVSRSRCGIQFNERLQCVDNG
jgi:hypothetical protein